MYVTSFSFDFFCNDTILFFGFFKMFDNIKSLKFGKDSVDSNIIKAMISSEGEIMNFNNTGKKYVLFYIQCNIQKDTTHVGIKCVAVAVAEACSKI